MATLEIHCILRPVQLDPDVQIKLTTSTYDKTHRKQTLQNMAVHQHTLADKGICLVKFHIVVLRSSRIELEAAYELPFNPEEPLTQCIKIENWSIEIVVRCFVVSTSEPLQQRNTNSQQKHEVQLLSSLQYLEAQKQKIELLLENKVQLGHKNKIQLTSQHLLQQKITKNNEKLKKLTKIVMGLDQFWNVRCEGQLKIKEYPQNTSIQVEKTTMLNMNPLRWKVKSKQPYHLIVMVHGMNGSSHDFRHFRKLFEQMVYCQKHRYIFLVSRRNETQHHISLEQQGEQLAKQVLQFVEPYRSQLSLISFIGHSLGGIIIRVALPKLYTLSHYLHSYVSLSAPHIGFLESGKLFGLGVRFLLQSRHEPFVKQLLFEDQKELENCYLYRLGEADGLNWFSRIILMGSEQDRYVGRESALLNASSGQALELVQRSLHGLTASEVVRYDVKFSIAERNFDSLTGRTAHLRFLQQKQVVQLVVGQILKES